MAQIMNSLLQTSFKFSSVAQSLTELSWLSSVKEPTLSDPMGYSMPGFPITNSQSLLKLMSIESVIPCNHFFLCCPLLLLPSIFPTISESAVHIRWPQYWSFSISPSSEYSGPTSFRIDWLDLLAVQGTLKSSPILQFKSIGSLVLSFLYGPTLASIHDYWKNCNFDQMDLCW